MVADDHFDIVPVRETFGYGRGASRVVGGQIGERLIGKDDAPPERVARPVAFDDDDLV